MSQGREEVKAKTVKKSQFNVTTLVEVKKNAMWLSHRALLKPSCRKILVC